jgi:hypothetical protein
LRIKPELAAQVAWSASKVASCSFCGVYLPGLLASAPYALFNPAVNGWVQFCNACASTCLEVVET